MVRGVEVEVEEVGVEEGCEGCDAFCKKGDVVRARRGMAVGRRERGAREDGRLGRVDSERRTMRLRVMLKL